MRVLIDKPPNFKAIEKTFGEIPFGTIFAYGNILYNPDNVRIADEIMVHEMVHEEQQKEEGVEAWWDRYLSDAVFRIEQEIEAYRMQYRAYKEKTPNVNLQRRYADRIAALLSSDLYGRAISFQAAARQISI